MKELQKKQGVLLVTIMFWVLGFSGEVSPGPGSSYKRAVLDISAFQRLGEIIPGQKIGFPAFPIAPDVEVDVIMEAVQLYQNDARLKVLAENNTWDVLPTPRTHFIGKSEIDQARIWFSWDERNQTLHGGCLSDWGSFEISGFTQSEGQLELAVNQKKTGQEMGLSTQCGTEDLPFPDELWDILEKPEPSSKTVRDSLLLATVAVDTDNEFNYYKFANNTTAATSYLEDLFLAMNVMYERDVNVRLLIGDVFFRLDTDPSPTFDDDPYIVNSSGAGSTHLTEFGVYWQNNMGSIDRTFAMLLSGKSSSNFSSSGIAWLDGYCEKQSSGGGYSVTQVFKFPGATAQTDLRVIAHELGHNFGSPHTHCYSPPIDTCYSGEGGCYSGGTSCPGGPGTMMSYCHIKSCGDNQVLFHSRVIDLLNTYIQAHAGNCLAVENPCPTQLEINEMRQNWPNGVTVIDLIQAMFCGL